MPRQTMKYADILESLLTIWYIIQLLGNHQSIWKHLESIAELL